MNKAKEIQFTDSRGKALFSIPNGGFLRLFYGNGDDNFALCRYVDEAHAEIDGVSGLIFSTIIKTKQGGIHYAKYSSKV